MGFDLGNVVGGHGDRHRALHALVNRGFALRRIEVGVGLEIQHDQLTPGFLVLRSGVFVEEGVGQGRDHVAGAAIIVFLALLLLRKLLRVVDQTLQAFVFLFTIGGAERLAVDHQQAADHALIGFDHLAGFNVLGPFLGEPVHVVRGVVLRRDIIGDGFAHQVGGIGGQVRFRRPLRRPGQRGQQQDCRGSQYEGNSPVQCPHENSR